MGKCVQQSISFVAISFNGSFSRELKTFLGKTNFSLFLLLKVVVQHKSLSTSDRHFERCAFRGFGDGRAIHVQRSRQRFIRKANGRLKGTLLHRR